MILRKDLNWSTTFALQSKVQKWTAADILWKWMNEHYPEFCLCTLNYSRLSSSSVKESELAWQQTPANYLIRHSGECLKATGMDPRRVAWSHIEQIQLNRFSCQLEEHSELSQQWSSHSVNCNIWSAGWRKERLKQRREKERHVLKLRRGDE